MWDPPEFVLQSFLVAHVFFGDLRDKRVDKSLADGHCKCLHFVGELPRPPEPGRIGGQTLVRLWQVSVGPGQGIRVDSAVEHSEVAVSVEECVCAVGVGEEKGEGGEKTSPMDWHLVLLEFRTIPVTPFRVRVICFRVTLQNSSYMFQSLPTPCSA